MNVTIGKEYKTTSRTDGWMWKFDDAWETHGIQFAAEWAKKHGVPCSMVIQYMRIKCAEALGLPRLLMEFESAMDSYHRMTMKAELTLALDSHRTYPTLRF